MTPTPTIVQQTPAPPPPAAVATAPAAPSPLTLAAATAAALSANPTANAAREQLTQAEARLAQAAAGQHFQVSLSTSAGLSNASVIQPPPSQESFYSVVNTVTVPLPLGRKPRAAVAQANAQVAAAQAQFASARLTLAGQVSAAYYDVLRKQALLAIAEDTLATAKRQQDEARKRFNAGDVPELDVTRAEAPVDTAEAGVEAATVAVTIARQALNTVLGRPLDDEVAVAEVTPESLTPTIALPVSLDEARKRARERSPDVLAAEAAIRADEEALRLSGLSREPSYELQAGDTRSNDQTSFSRLDNVQATVVIPLTDGGLARAQKREAQSVLDQARAQAEAARRTAEATVSAAYLNAGSSLRQIEAARKAQQIAETAYDKTLLGYQNGLFTLSDVLSAQSARTQARIAYTQALYDAAVAAATLQNALGSLPQ